MAEETLVLNVLNKYYSSMVLHDNALFPLYIADMDAEGRNSTGLGWNEIGDEMRPVPMMARLPEVVREGDELYLYWTETRPNLPPEGLPAEPPVQHYVLDEATVQRGWLSFAVTRPELNLPANLSDLHPYTGYFYYSLEDGLSRLRRYSNAREVQIDLEVPGGLDPDTGTPINSNLAAPAVAPVSVTPGVNVTMTLLPWINQQPGDQVTVIWSGVRYVDPRRLEAEDIGAPFVINVPTEVIKQGGDGEQLPVQYEVRDRVQNYSRPSLAALVNVHIDPSTLAAPEVSDAAPPLFELDLDLLDQGDVEVGVPTGIEIGVTLVMHWIGLTPDGHEVAYASSPPRVYRKTRDLIFDVPNAYASFVAGGTARVFYEVTSGTGEVRRSRTRLVRIVGGSANILRPPIVVEAVGDLIDLAEVTQNTFHVRIPLYPGQMQGDEVIVTLTGRPTNGLPLVLMVEATVPENGERVELTLAVTAEYLRLILNGTLSLGYTVFTPSLGITRRSTSDPIYFVEDRRIPAFPPLTCPQLVSSDAGVFLPSDAPLARFFIPEDAPLSPGQVIEFRLGVAGSEVPPPVTRSAVFTKFPFSFLLANDDFQQFDEIDVEATYSVERKV